MNANLRIRHKETLATGTIRETDPAKGTATVHWDGFITDTLDVPLAELDPAPSDLIVDTTPDILRSRY
jgi:hypothetical protein